MDRIGSVVEGGRSTAKTGATIAPVFGGRGSLPLLAALFLPALSSLLCHCALSPPSCGIGREEHSTAHRSVAADRHADGAPAGARRFVATPARHRAGGL